MPDRPFGDDSFEEDFGPEPWTEPEPPASGTAGARQGPRGSGPIPGVPCGGDGCFLRPAAELFTRFGVELARRGHTDSMAQAASSGLELLKALRQFLDEEIAYAERLAEARRNRPRYSKIPVD